MSTNLWERFDGIVTATEVDEVVKSFAPLVAGEYEGKLEELVAGESKSGLPMLKGKFRLATNRVVFYNQVLQNANNPAFTAMNVAKAVNDVGFILGEEIEFTTLGEFAGLVMGMTGMDGKVLPEFADKVLKLKISYGKNDLEMKFPIVSVEGEALTSVDDGDVPF
jgi:hypothetical protein